MNWYKRAFNTFFISYSDEYGNLEVITDEGKDYTYTGVEKDDINRLQRLIQYENWREGWKFLKILLKQQNVYQDVLSTENAV